MRPDDDLMLGKILKDSGAHQLLLFGNDMVSVEWYSTLSDAQRGFRKNAYAALRYNFPVFVVATLGTLVQCVWPFIAVWTATGEAQLLYGVTIGALLAAYAITCVHARLPVWLTAFYPIAALLQTSMLVIAVGHTLIAGGIDWRGTFYSLDQLKANRV